MVRCRGLARATGYCAIGEENLGDVAVSALQIAGVAEVVVAGDPAAVRHLVDSAGRRSR